MARFRFPQFPSSKIVVVVQTFDNVLDPDKTGYNGAAGAVLTTVNIGPVHPPQREGRVPQCSRNQLIELQAKFDDLEQAKVFRRPEDVGITVESFNQLFLEKKASVDHRFVTAFADVLRSQGTVSQQPSLIPDVDTTLRTIAPWRCLIKTELTRAFYQIRLCLSSLKYCGVATPFRGIRVNTKTAIGMPGPKAALEKMRCCDLGDFIQEAKLADDPYCDGDSPEALLTNWRRVFEALTAVAYVYPLQRLSFAQSRPSSLAGYGRMTAYQLALTVSQ